MSIKTYALQSVQIHWRVLMPNDMRTFLWNYKIDSTTQATTSSGMRRLDCSVVLK